jgi:hypothetical protein
MLQAAIKETINTPSVSVFDEDRLVVVSGTSKQEDPKAFYEELDNLLEKCATKFKKDITLDFSLIYINTSSSKWLFHILKNIQVNYSTKKDITINWFYESDDEVIQEAGEVFKSLLDIPFNLIEVD